MNAPSVTHVLARLNVGGPAAVVAALASGDRDVRVLAGAVQAGECEYGDLRAWRAHIVRVPGLGRSVRATGDLRALGFLVRELRRSRPDIVHTHTAKAGVLGRVAAAGAGVPLRVHTFHGHLLHGYFGAGRTQAVVGAERLLARRTTALVAVGRRVRDELLEAGIGRPEQYVVIPPCVVLPEPPGQADARNRLGLDRSRPVAAFVGRLVPIKRPDRLLEVARLMPDVQFLVAGDGPLGPQLRAAAGANVRFLGWRGDAETVWAAADVAILTSDNEGMPVTLIEAAMCGVPAVTTDAGSAGEVVLDEQTGLVVQFGAAALASAVSRLLQDSALRTAMGRSARAHASAFSVAPVVAAHEQLYASMIASQ